VKYDPAISGLSDGKSILVIQDIMLHVCKPGGTGTQRCIPIAIPVRTLKSKVK